MDTLLYIEKMIRIRSTDRVLDLCGGNGLIAKHLAPKCKSITVVDIAEELINKIDRSKYKNINAIIADIRNLDFKKNAFSKIIIYAGIQYLTYKETIFLFENTFRWLADDGLIFLGDIPDLSRIWSFFDSKEREGIFFESLRNDKPIVGTWFHKDFLQKLAVYCGFRKCSVIDQSANMIYSHFRYDMLIKK
jgi:ubiquinone/menaquinone biosynthesis C-methylase UbiE